MLTRATVGLLAVAGVFCLLLILQLAGGRVDRLLLVWVAWALLAGACVWWLARGGAKPRVPKPAQGFLAAGVIVGLVQFWYTNQYVPASREPGLSVAVTLVRAAGATATPATVTVVGTITVKNVGKSKVRITGTRYRLRSLTSTGDRLIQSGPLAFTVGNWLEDDQEAGQTKVFFVPADVGRALRLDVDFDVGKADRFSLSTEPVLCRDDVDLARCPAGRAWTVHESSLLNELLRGQRYLRQSIIGDRVSTCFAPAGHDASGDFGDGIGRCADRLRTVYGSARVGAGVELAL